MFHEAHNEMHKFNGNGYKPRPLSAVFQELVERESTENISIGCIRAALADRSFATLLVITSMLNLLPFPPGSTIILGVPIVIVAWQMVIGRKTVWLPQFFLKRSLSKAAFDKMATKMIPFVQKLEAWIKPRNWPFANAKSAEKIIGVWALVLGIAVILPVPLGNWFPAISCAVCGAALSERDGTLLAIGVVMGITSIIILIAVAAAIFFGFSWAISGL